MATAPQESLTTQPLEAVLVLGKELRRDPDRGRRELAARAAAAAVLWRMHDCVVVCFEAPLRGQTEAGSAIVGRFLAEHGVPDSAVRLSRRSRSTREEVLLLAAAAHSHGWKRIAVVTSRYHAVRARRMVDEVMGEGGARVVVPEELAEHADAWERERIRAGTPCTEVLRRERRVEALMTVLAYSLRPLPASLRFRVEVVAGGVLRRATARP